MIIIGLTGGVGCGKSKVLEYMKEKVNCRILLADEVAHLVKQPGTEGYRRLVKLLGEEILTSEGEIDRLKMADRIFQQDGLLEQVNAILHPAVKDYILEAIREEEKRQQTAVFFLEAALLIEAGYLAYLDELWYIYSDEATRHKRLMQGRGYTAEKTQSIMNRQLAEEEFRRYAHVVIDNSNEFSDTCVQLEREARRLGFWK